MFDVSMSEMLVILVVALVVIGPERLPKVARTLGHLWGSGRRYVNSVKSDIERDMAIEEYRQLTEKVQREAVEAQQALSSGLGSAEKTVDAINRAVATPVQTQAAMTETTLSTVSNDKKLPIDR